MEAPSPYIMEGNGNPYDHGTRTRYTCAYNGGACNGIGAAVPIAELWALPDRTGERKGLLPVRWGWQAVPGPDRRHWRERAGARALAHRPSDPRPGGEAYPHIQSLLSRVSREACRTAGAGEPADRLVLLQLG